MGWQDVIMSSFCHDAGGTESRVARPGGHARHQSARLTTSGNTSYSLIGCFATMPAPRLAGLWAAAHLNVCFDTMPSFDWLFSCYVCSLIDWIMSGSSSDWLFCYYAFSLIGWIVSGSSSDWLFCDTACSLIGCFATIPFLTLLANNKDDQKLKNVLALVLQNKNANQMFHKKDIQCEHFQTAVYFINKYKT